MKEVNDLIGSLNLSFFREWIDFRIRVLWPTPSFLFSAVSMLKCVFKLKITVLFNSKENSNIHF